jgi:uncharacterized membrane protein
VGTVLDGADEASPLVSTKESRDRTKRIAGLVTVLALGSFFLLEIILEEGGWRAWLGSIAGVALLLVLISEIRAAIRERRAERG